jgi:hypothetical protein
MPRVKLLMAYAGKQPGDTIDVPTDEEASWLVGIGRATSDKFPAYQQTPFAAGEHGPDPLAGGDPTRLYGHATPKVERRENHATPVPGSPIQYNKGVAPEGEPARPQDVSGRPDAKREAQANRERPAGAPRLETGDPAPAPGKTSDGKASDKPAARKTIKS